MYLKELEISGFKSFANKSKLKFDAPISAIVGPNGSGKSNIAEAFRFVLGEQSIKNMRGKRGEDLIFNGTNSTPRQSRASVKVVFDNSDKTLPVDFEEVSIERIVFRDGVNEYKINNSPVRLKDIVELLASANVGSSGHHIISQGEADKILNTNPKDRKNILEEALGLKIFQYKKTESEKKLTKTQENIDQVESLRREIAPHIKFLKKQVEKIEIGKKMKMDLLVDYKDYLKRESVYLKFKKNDLIKKVEEPKRQLSEIEDEIIKLQSVSKQELENESTIRVKQLETELSVLINKKGEFLRQQGKLEGEIGSLEKLSAKIFVPQQKSSFNIEIVDFNNFKKDIDLLKVQYETSSDVENLKKIINSMVILIENFFSTKIEKTDNDIENKRKQDLLLEIDQIKNNLNQIKIEIEKIIEDEKKNREEIHTLKQKIDLDKSESIEAERKIINLMSLKNDLQQKMSNFAIEIDNFNRDEYAFKQEITESVALCGRDVLYYESLDINEDEIISEDRQKQIDRRKQLERIKIKLEEFGIGSDEEVLKEFNEVTERDNFLIKEIEDLQKSSESLKQLIIELEEKIDSRFKEGINKINKEFQNFFELMFGGGTASINIIKTKSRKNRSETVDADMFDDEKISQIIDESEDEEEGIDISINLPRKKVKGLMMLSGGERALTSIALIFAMSQVNPPPFIILDETDAALDEANSRKYGDMIVNLSKHSQLILITHNRETMGRAGVIYGVTMAGGISKLLSINFEKGIEWAK